MGPTRNPSSAPPVAASLPSEAARGLAPGFSDEQRVPLRLTVTRGVLGMELYEAVELGPLEVTNLSIALPNLKFPLDLSGGVPQFRHRRGELEHLALRVRLSALGRLFEARVGDVIGPLVRPPTVFAQDQGIGFGLVGEGRALAFDLLWVPEERHARFVVNAARGVGLGGAALGFALRALDGLFSGIGERRGRVVTVRDVGSTLARALLPAIGARAPAARRVRLGPLHFEGDTLHAELDATFASVELSALGTRALELGALVEAADDALSRGDVDEARAGYLAGLEQAPRHPELVRLVADIDLQIPERAEAALAWVVETLPALRAGLTGAELLWRVGDFDGARQALTEAAEREPFAALAALMWCRLAECDDSPIERRTALDRAVALAPGLALPRARRFAARLERGDSPAALADAEHLEAMASGARAKHESNLRVARAFAAAGFMREARRCFERALRYAPDDARATAGLARALLDAGLKRRATTLLARAVALSERAGQPDADALLDLAAVLASELQDLPQAIARLRQVSAASPRYVEARRLEAQFRATLGDIAGASLCYARMREAIESSLEPARDSARWLLEAAEFERVSEGDLLAAERHLALALRLAPHDAELAERYRAVAREALLAARQRRSND